MRDIIREAMQNSDELVVEMEYCDSAGQQSRRVISPIRYLSSGRLLALCLCRAEPRQFHLDRCSNLQLRRSSDFLMPVAFAAPATFEPAVAG